MRAGICTVQQALTPESAVVVKQAVSLARRRGHAQVTPLHVASAMLASSTSLLRKACLQSHPHPLQYKALELCFNVALNRLPASSPSPALAPHSPLPSLSNALVAAFKRAQAHQRRGSADNQNQNQNQPVLVVRIELEQLVISILDDPSVSRVMREAGISSTQVRNKVEQSVLISSATSNLKNDTATQPQVLTLGHSVQPSAGSPLRTSVARNKPMFDLKFMSEDITSVLDTLVSKRKNIVILGKSLERVEAVVRGVADRFEKGLVYGELRYVQFMSLPLMHFRNLSKEQVEQKLMELRLHMKGYVARGVILYLGDLQCVFEYWPRRNDNYGYCSIEHAIVELKRMVLEFAYRENERRMWLMGIGNSQSYNKSCRKGNISRETFLDLHPLMIPDDTLSLSLNLCSESDTQHEKISQDRPGWPATEMISTRKESKKLSFDISLFPKTEPDQSVTSYGYDQDKKSDYSKLPSWFLHQEDVSEQNSSIKNQECVSVMDLCKNWSTFCNSSQTKNTHISTENALNFYSLSPSSSASVSSHDHNAVLNQSPLNFPINFESKLKEKDFWASDQISDEAIESLPKPDLLSNPNSSPNSASSSEATERDLDGLNMFKELSPENMNILSDALEKKVPHQGEVIQVLVRTVLRCRSRLTSETRNERNKQEDAWLLFAGPDYESKTLIAKELARLVFGSQSDLVFIKPGNFFFKQSESSEEHPNKKRKTRESISNSYIERFSDALNENPHRVFFLEDPDEFNPELHKAFEEAIEKGSVTLDDGSLSVPVKDAIVIFGCKSSNLALKEVSSLARQPVSDDAKTKNEESSQFVSLDLNIAIKDDVSGAGIGGLESVLDGKFYFAKS